MDSIYEYFQHQQNKNVQFSNTQLNDLLPNEKTIEIIPRKGFVIKTYEKNNGGKVYFNICFSDSIAEFHLKKIPDTDNLEGLRVPLSIGEEKKKKDKKGNDYKTYDIVLNTKIVLECKKNEEIKKVIAELVQLGVQNKYKVETCSNLFFFPKHKYKGSTPESHYVKDDQQHKIKIVQEDKEKKEEEKRETESAQVISPNQSTHDVLTIKKPEWDLWFIEKEILEKQKEKAERFFIPFLRKHPIKGMLDGFEFKPPFLKSQKNKRKNKKELFRSILNDYNIDLDDDFLPYEKIINSFCVIQILLPFLVLGEYNYKRIQGNENNPLDIQKCVSLYISDEYVSIFFKKSPLFPEEYNPPYKDFTIRFPFYFESAHATSQYLEEYHLLNIIIPVSKNCISSSICSSTLIKEGRNQTNVEKVFTYQSEPSSDDSMF